ncbi:unnamed protein product [Candida parapsilosis]
MKISKYSNTCNKSHKIVTSTSKKDNFYVIISSVSSPSLILLNMTVQESIQNEKDLTSNSSLKDIFNFQINLPNKGSVARDHRMNEHFSHG